MVPKGKRSATLGNRHGGRVALSLDVESEVRDALRERAAASGVSMAEYVANAIATPVRLFATPSAAQAEILVRLSYEIARARIAIASRDNKALAASLESARVILADALRPLSQSHGDEIHSLDRRRAGGWSG